MRGKGTIGAACASSADCAVQSEVCLGNVCRRHIGATILYATENTSLNYAKPLWKNATDGTGAIGTFVGCGAVVTGLNDSAQTITCLKAHQQINAGVNGCAFPSGYTGWSAGTPTPTPTNTPTPTVTPTPGFLPSWLESVEAH
jgi:hypothetical protein